MTTPVTPAEKVQDALLYRTDHVLASLETEVYHRVLAIAKCSCGCCYSAWGDSVGPAKTAVEAKLKAHFELVSKRHV